MNSSAGSFSEDRPLGWDPAAAGSRAGDGMACNDSDRRQWRMLGAAIRTRVRGESYPSDLYNQLLVTLRTVGGVSFS
ncbi:MULTISPECIES: hypothetical protein [Faecalibacterium]|uniref:Uncharacterized protein n=1 Tax=Faecalibacterium hominis (ex Afrizal et al. 2022) TaxID=2881265 RepID=A0ABS8FGB9_9FIRM|nr:hypothetical protein [Faecalibacterium hominis (ex Afrizal et al. 2022)]MCC2213549.1 hypothetical protein [Faecalibacterium hominis (ex Afrizal et al. 2022)]